MLSLHDFDGRKARFAVSHHSSDDRYYFDLAKISAHMASTVSRATRRDASAFEIGSQANIGRARRGF
jgi:hypothetical protein